MNLIVLLNFAHARITCPLRNGALTCTTHRVTHGTEGSHRCDPRLALHCQGGARQTRKVGNLWDRGLLKLQVATPLNDGVSRAKRPYTCPVLKAASAPQHKTVTHRTPPHLFVLQNTTDIYPAHPCLNVLPFRVCVCSHTHFAKRFKLQPILAKRALDTHPRHTQSVTR